MIHQNLRSILDHLPNSVTLAAVSKYKPIEDLQEAYDAGQRIFAESRPLELRDKYVALPKDIKWHFIGHLQTNKIKYIIDFVDLIQSVDSFRLLDTLDKEAQKAGRVVDVLLEVFVAKEETKQGFSPEEIIELFSNRSLSNYPNIQVVGLMAMASFTDNEAQISSEFKSVRSLYDRVNTDFNANMTTLSMGMSSDYELAIAQGANLVRIGSSIFGGR